MSEQKQASVSQLEARVEELTQAMAEANHQSQCLAKHLETSAQISRVIASTLDIETLNKQIVKIMVILLVY